MLRRLAVLSAAARLVTSSWLFDYKTSVEGRLLPRPGMGTRLSAGGRRHYRCAIADRDRVNAGDVLSLSTACYDGSSNVQQVQLSLPKQR